MKKLFAAMLLCLACTVIFTSCRKNGGINLPDPSVQPDLEIKITASVEGFITDENGKPVMGASVSAGGKQATTNQFGFFSLQNAQLVK